MTTARLLQSLLGALASLLLLGCAATTTQGARDRAPVACAADDARILLSRLGFATACSARLQPGETIVLQVPAGSDLVIRADRRLDPRDLRVGLSNGTGIVRYPQLVLLDGKLIIPAAENAAAVHVRRPAKAGDALRITFELPPGAPPTVSNPREFRIPGSKVHVLGPDGQAEEGAYTVLRENTPVQITVSGPTTLAFQTRPIFSGQGNWTKIYRIETTLDGTPHGVLDFEASPDLSASLGSSNADLAVGTRQTEELAVPEGDHVLTVIPSQELLMRVGSEAPLREVAAQGIWSLSQSWTGNLGPFLCSDPNLLEDVARRTARDNTRLGGALVASAGLEHAAALRPREAEIDSAASRIAGAYTFFRDLVPERPSGLQQEVAYVAEPRVAREASEPPVVAAPAALGTQILLDRLIRGIFVSVTSADRSLHYVLPRREAASELRILVDRAALEGVAELLVSYDGAAATPLLVLPARDLPSSAYRSSAGELGLLRVAQQAGVRLDDATRTASFASVRPTGKLLNGGTVRLPLPVGVRQVQIWSPTPKGLRVALQYRAASTSGLGQDSYLGEVRRLGRDNARKLFAEALTAAISCSSWLEAPERCAFVQRVRAPGPIAVDELYNDWIGVLRLLRSRERALLTSLPENLRVAPPAQPNAGLEPIGDMAASAEQAVGAGRPEEALQRWSEMGRAAATGDDWARAQIGMADALLALGEPFIAERLLKNLYLVAPSSAIRRAAYQRLAAHYQAEGSPEELVGLHAAELARGASAAGLRDLASALAAEGQDEMAAKLAALLPAGDVAGLEQVMQRAGWGDVPAGSGRAPQAGTLQDAEHLIRQSAGAISYLVTARGTYGRFYQAKPDQPLRLEVDGPVRLRISGRPLHTSAAAAPFETWFTVSVGESRIAVPVTANYPTPGLELVGIAGEAGTAVTETVMLGAGRHVLSVAPEEGTLLVEAEVEERAAAQAAGLTPAQRLAGMLQSFEVAAEGREAVLAEAAQLAQQHLDDPAVASVWQRFSRQSGWERITSVETSAGVRTVEIAGLLPETRALRTRLALLPALGPGERLIQSTGETALSVVHPEPVTVEATLSLSAVPTMPSAPVTVRYRLDEGEPVELQLTTDQPTRKVIIPVPDGEHVVRFSAPRRHANQFVRLLLRENDSTIIGETQERIYDVATKEEPVTLTLQGPAWLRIDEYRDGETVQRTRLVEAGVQTIALYPEEGRSEALMRIFRLVPDPEPAATPPRLPASAERVPSLPPPASGPPACPA